MQRTLALTPSSRSTCRLGKLLMMELEWSCFLSNSPRYMLYTSLRTCGSLESTLALLPPGGILDSVRLRMLDEFACLTDDKLLEDERPSPLCFIELALNPRGRLLVLENLGRSIV